MPPPIECYQILLVGQEPSVVLTRGVVHVTDRVHRLMPVWRAGADHGGASKTAAECGRDAQARLKP